MNNKSSLVKILLSDDDEEDCLFFKEALEELPLQTTLNMVHDGEQLMHYLLNHISSLPDILFLDLNMPRKKGCECLAEIRNNPLMNALPVVIFSTSCDKEKASMLYETGAHYYVCKPPGFEELKMLIHRVLNYVEQNKSQPPRENFMLNQLRTLF